MNPYAYAEANPICRLDPSGMQWYRQVSKYYTRYKDQVWSGELERQKPQEKPLYEEFFHEVTVAVDASRCKQNSANCASNTAHVVIFFESIRSGIIRSPQTEGIKQSGIYIPMNRKFYKARKLPQASKRVGRDVYWAGTEALGRIPCAGGRLEGDVYYTMKDEGESRPDILPHAYRLRVIVELKKCGKEIDIDFHLTFINPDISLREGRHVVEVKGPADPLRPPYLGKDNPFTR